jgi:large subunit ribosomal protein L18
MAKKTRQEERQAVHRRVRATVRGSGQRPRLCVFRSSKHIYSQIVDDVQGTTLAAASTLDQSIGAQSGGNVKTAREVGKLIAARALDKGIKQVVFDRGGYRYHGRIKALADAARESGLEF